MNPRMPEDEAQKLRYLVASLDFVFAKTMPEIPHFYFIRDRHPEAYRALSEAIAQFGVDGQFHGRTYRYLYFDERRYWAIDPVLNRARSDQPC